MSSPDDNANGAQQTRYHRNPPEECGRVVRLVCSSYAHDVDDARELFGALGLNPGDGRRTAPSRNSPVLVGRRSERPSATPALGGPPASSKRES